MARITIAQVAAAAGVDKATVSRALRGDGRISRATRDKVWHWARQLGYQPDSAARDLAGQESRLVAAVADWSEPGRGALLARLLRVCSRHRYDLLVYSPGDGAAALARRLSSRRVQALLWEGDMPDDVAMPCPVLCLGGCGKGCYRVPVPEEPWNDKVGASLGVSAGRLLIDAAQGKGAAVKNLSSGGSDKEENS